MVEREEQEEAAGDPRRARLEAGLRAAYGPDPFATPPAGVLGVLRATVGTDSDLVLPDPKGHQTSGAPETGQPQERGTSSHLGRYEVLGEVGRGGMGAILRGRDPDLGREVALKVLRGPAASDPERVRRFLDEARIGGQLQHPGIVPLYELGLGAERTPFFTMKLVEGKTLRTLLAARRDPSEDRRRFLSIFEQVCQAIAYAHARRVVHRDLKPSNVMVGPFGEVLVMDWGLAKVLHRRGAEASAEEERTPASERTDAPRGRSGDWHSREGSVIGSPGYMSPEQACGEIKRIDERSDVFALGSILCEILTGKPAFAGGTPEEARRKAETGGIEEALVRLEGCGADEDIARLAKECVCPDPAGRPGNAGTVAKRMAAYLASAEERARAADLAAASAAGRAEEEKRARRLTVALAFFAVAGTLVGAGLHLRAQVDRKSRAAQIANAVGETLEEARVAQERARNGPPMDLSAWTEALGAAKRAVALASAPEVDEGVRERTRSLLRDVVTAEKAAKDELARGEADRRMVARLKKIRLRASGSMECPGATEYAEAFREYGIDVEALDPEEAARRIRSSAVGSRIVAELDSWARFLRCAEGPGGRLAGGLRAIASAADADPTRRKIRLAREEADLATLRGIASSPETGRLPLDTLGLLADSLLVVGEEERAVEVRRAAQRCHRDDFWANFDLGHAFYHLPSPRLEEAIRFTTAALAIEAENTAALNQLGLALWKKGDQQGALEAYQEALGLEPEDAVVLTNLGVLLFKDLHDRDWAIASFREAIRLDPKYAPAHSNLGIALWAAGDLAGAIASSQEAIRLQPENVRARVALGDFLREKGDVQGAVASLREALRWQPGDAEALQSLGAVLCDQVQDFDGATAAFRELVRLRPEDSGAHFNLGNALQGKGELVAAVAAYREAIRLSPEYAEAFNNLGNTLRKKGDLDDAKTAYREALRIRPDLTTAWLGLGVLLCNEVKDFEGAIAAFRELIRLHPQDPEAHFGLGNALQGKGELVAAVAAYREAIRLSPEHAAAYNNLGNTLRKKGDLDEAKAAFREALRIRPDLGPAWRGLAGCLAQEGNRDEAERGYREWIRVDPRSAVAHSRLGALLLAYGEAEEAAVAFRRAVELNPADSEALTNLGIALRTTGHREEAIRTLRGAAGIRLDDPLIHFELGSALEAEGRFREALESYRRAEEFRARRPGWDQPADKRARACERMIDLEASLVTILREEKTARDAEEQLLIAKVCRARGLYAAAVRFWDSAFAAAPALAEGFRGWNRYDAACDAALAGSGRGNDAEPLPGGERARWRGKALEWLRAELDLWKTRFETGAVAAREVRDELAGWRRDPDLHCVREDPAVDTLPESERDSWRGFWTEVEALRANAAERALRESRKG